MMKEYEYRCTTSVIWTTFDFGVVMAHDVHEAREKALETLKIDFAMANEALDKIGHSIEFNPDAIEIEEVKVKLN